jgi:hypothetical protein
VGQADVAMRQASDLRQVNLKTAAAIVALSEPML